MCETFLLFCLRASSSCRLMSGCEPMPTPTTGCAAYTGQVTCGERDPVARHLTRRIAAALGEDDDARSEDERDRHAHDDAAGEPVAGEKRDDEHGAEERDEARLRVGEVEAERRGAEHGEAERPGDQSRARAR